MVQSCIVTELLMEDMSLVFSVDNLYSTVAHRYNNESADL